MQENRSFDHYFGTLGGVAGFGDPNALVQTDPTAPFDQVQGKSIFYQYDPYNPDNYLLPWHLDTLNTSSQAIPSTSHAWYYQQPWNTAFSSDGFTAYVTNSNDNTVSVINTATQKVTKRSRSVRSPTPTQDDVHQPNQIPTAIALAPDNRYMWVACNVSGSLAIIDTTTNAVTSTARPVSAPSRPRSRSPHAA
jgi:YVTN family beta-propeller protein